MYTREIQAPRAAPIENGKPIQGTWTQAFEEVDLLGIHRPYPFPLPKWMRDSRVKEWESFIVQDDTVYLDALLCNMKHFRVALVSFYDKQAKEHSVFRKIIPFGGWAIPQSLANDSVDSRSYGFFFRIHDWLDAATIRVDLNIQPTRKRPALTAHLRYDLAALKSSPQAVSLLFSERRGMYSYKVMTPVQGDIVFAGRHISLDPARACGIFRDYKGFFPYRMQSAWNNGTGFAADGRRIGFSLGENQTRETFSNNENALWLDGAVTPLPPVRITMPQGVDSDWVIQDLEGMVDLTFTPQTHSRQTLDFIAAKADYNMPLGCYNGMLVNSEGAQIPVRNLWGAGEKLYLRV
jgi:hypothetical protein